MPTPKDVLVTVTVDTSAITQENVRQTIVLSDDNGGSDQTPNDSCTFLSKINDKAKVTFEIRAKDGSTGVSFVSFDKTGSGPNVMNPMPRAPHWRATVAGAQKDKESYKFVIDVSGKGEFTLDPDVEVIGP
ncbi:MAG: hypothetical protein ABJO02_13540 [Reichenbachiella sp.]|uniref:hypothetical protein n=1 Tax=Reichenbachiella sp. TaxID=2184521 RepID=UPI003297A89C